MKTRTTSGIIDPKSETGSSSDTYSLHSPEKIKWTANKDRKKRLQASIIKNRKKRTINNAAEQKITSPNN